MHLEGQNLQQTTERTACPVPREDCEEDSYASLQVVQSYIDRFQRPAESGRNLQGWVCGTHESGQEREAMAVMSVQIAPEEGSDRVYQLKDKSGSIMNVQINSEAIYRDDLTGQVLDPELVRIARAKELE